MASAFVIARPDGSSRRVGGYRYAPPPPNARKFRPWDSPISHLPAKVDLRGWMACADDQGETNCCVACAVAAAYEYLLSRHRGVPYRASRLFVYFNARELAGWEDLDEGTTIAHALEGLRVAGACAENDWPYASSLVNEKPPKGAYDRAAGFLVEELRCVPADVLAWKHALAQGYPIVFGINLYASFDAHRYPGVVPFPPSSAAVRAAHGGHAMLCVGYSDRDHLFIVRNSWGPSWGDGGYCYIPYDYVMCSDYAADAWLIRQSKRIDLDVGTWGEATTIVTEPGTLLGQMGDTEFEDFLDDLGHTSLEERLALLFLRGVEGDDDLDDTEIEGIARCMRGVFVRLGSPFEPAKVLQRALHAGHDEALLAESIDLLGRHLSKATLGGIVDALKSLRCAEGLADDEDGFLANLVETWQVAQNWRVSAPHRAVEDDDPHDDVDDEDEHEDAG